jgi:hypothetical protein
MACRPANETARALNPTLPPVDPQSAKPLTIRVPAHVQMASGKTKAVCVAVLVAFMSFKQTVLYNVQKCKLPFARVSTSVDATSRREKLNRLEWAATDSPVIDKLKNAGLYSRDCRLYGALIRVNDSIFFDLIR